MSTQTLFAPPAGAARSHAMHDGGAALAVEDAGRCATSVERNSSMTLLVCWSDPGRCRYTEQTWKIGYARAPGRCALSDAEIHVGDRVFRPWGRPAPMNAEAMILASEAPQHPPE
jgi:hypothetical protein